MTAEAAPQRYLEDVELGDEYEEEAQPTSEDVKSFLALNPARGAGPGDGRFESVEGARSIGLAAPIVPGNMSLSILSRLVEDWTGSQGRVHEIDVSFRRPVQQNDRLKLIALVTDSNDEAGGARVKLDLYIENERGERPLQGTAVVELPHRPS